MQRGAGMRCGDYGGATARSLTTVVGHGEMYRFRFKRKK